jgi:hypothetical protein
MLNVPRLAGIISSMGWFARLAGTLLIEARHVYLYHSVQAFDKFLFYVFSTTVS